MAQDVMTLSKLQRSYRVNFYKNMRESDNVRTSKDVLVLTATTPNYPKRTTENSKSRPSV